MKWNYVKENGVVNYRGDTMERLTFDGNFCDIAQCRELPCRYNTACTQRQVWEKLKAYENTGLTPKQTAEFAIWIHENGLEKIKEWIKADKDGRLVVLPAKTVYELVWDAGSNCDGMCPVSIDGVGCCDFCDAGELCIYEAPCKQEHIGNIGKTVFLTREEAENALEASEDG